MRAYVSQLICHFGRIWRICIGLFCAKRFLGLSVPRNMGPSVPAFMELRVNLRCQMVCVYLTCFLNLGLRENLGPLSDSGLSVPSIYGVASEFEVSISLCLYNMF